MLHKAMGAGLALVLSVVMGNCWAQANVGELLSQGGQKLSKEDLQKLHEGGSRKAVPWAMARPTVNSIGPTAPFPAGRGRADNTA